MNGFDQKDFEKEEDKNLSFSLVVHCSFVVEC
jgi:hypothetical protein